MEEMEVNGIELERQRKQELLSRKGIARVEIIVTDNEDDIPYCNVMIRRVSPLEVAKLCFCMKKTIAKIYSDHPEVKEIEKALSATTKHIEGSTDELIEHLKQLREEGNNNEKPKKNKTFFGRNR